MQTINEHLARMLLAMKKKTLKNTDDFEPQLPEVVFQPARHEEPAGHCDMPVCLQREYISYKLGETS